MARFLNILLVVPLVACSEQGQSPETTPEFEETVAWVGESATGLRVVAEPVFRHAMSRQDVYDEERMLREVFSLADDSRLVRVHLIGRAEELGSVGSFAEGASPFAPLQKPDNLDLRGENLWQVLVAGGPAPTQSGQQRRSFLLGAKSDYSEDILPWSNGVQTVELQQRSWRGRERQQYLTPSEEKTHE